MNYTATSPAKYGTSVETVDAPIYALAQCQPTMVVEDCWSCLTYLHRRMPDLLQGKRDGRLRQWRCFYNFADYKFFAGDPILHLPKTCQFYENKVQLSPDTSDLIPILQPLIFL